MIRLALVLAALFVLPSAAGAAPAARTWATAHRVYVEQTLTLAEGRASASFDFAIHGKFVDRVTLVVPHGARMHVTARSANRMQQATGSTSSCRRRGAVDVCERAQEWCGLIQGPWRATVTKTSEPAAAVRVLLVFVR